MSEFRDGVAAEVDESADATAARPRRGTLLILGIRARSASIARIVLGVLLARSITRPLGVLVERLKMMSSRCVSDLRKALDAMAKGDLTQSVTPVTPLIESTAKDEIGQACRLRRDPHQHRRHGRDLQRDARGARQRHRADPRHRGERECGGGADGADVGGGRSRGG